MSTHGTLVRDSNHIALGAKIYVRVPRARRKFQMFERELGYKPQYYFSLRFEGNFALVDGDEYERVKSLVTRARINTDQLLQCWS